LDIEIKWHHYKEDGYVINVKGILDFETRDHFKLTVRDYLESNQEYLTNNSKLILDLGEISYMDVAGFGSLNWLRNRLAVLNAKVEFHVIISPEIERIFEIARAQKTMNVYGSLQDAYCAIFST